MVRIKGECHVIPCNDLREHAPHGCACNPV
ncbi:hypothetical protein HDG38_001888, partial [Paraburkholderia sp. WSM4177]|nr:hypothetical protein [Paraburkholderia sp. WSM4177]MBB5483116.1 hypothetical protein [Paraburkholderia sp. WSM4180]